MAMCRPGSPLLGGSKPPQPDQRLGIEPTPGNKEHPKHLAQRPPDSILLCLSFSFTVFLNLSLSFTHLAGQCSLNPQSVSEWLSLTRTDSVLSLDSMPYLFIKNLLGCTSLSFSVHPSLMFLFISSNSLLSVSTCVLMSSFAIFPPHVLSFSKNLSYLNNKGLSVHFKRIKMCVPEWPCDGQG